MLVVNEIQREFRRTGDALLRKASAKLSFFPYLGVMVDMVKIRSRLNLRGSNYTEKSFCLVNDVL